MTADMTADRKKIPGYPDNLMPAAAHPAIPSPVPRMAFFILMILALAVVWQHFHAEIGDRRQNITGVFTLGFFAHEGEMRSPREQAEAAYAVLEKLPAAEELSLIDGRTLPAFADREAADTAVPALIHLRAAAGQEAALLDKLAMLADDFPTAELRDHSLDPQIAALQQRYTRFLRILDAGILAGFALLLVFAVMSLRRALRPQGGTIDLMHLLGADDGMLLYVFSRHALRGIFRGVLAGALIVTVFCAAVYLLYGDRAVLPGGITVAPLPLLWPLAAGIFLLYIAARLGTKNLLRRRIMQI
ncbi:MAG: hypothetical protein EA357_12245 [Micavibrio sp.]|nr:MAG: hypothetical protein EA357_12245 [Micavibrio sp.]